MTPIWAPRVRMWRTSFRVSIPCRPTTPCRFRYASRLSVARQLLASSDRDRTTMPTACGRALSSSVGLAPTLPISGAAMVTIWPTYDGSVRISW